MFDCHYQPSLEELEKIAIKMAEMRKLSVEIREGTNRLVVLKSPLFHLETATTDELKQVVLIIERFPDCRNFFFNWIKDAIFLFLAHDDTEISNYWKAVFRIFWAVKKEFFGNVVDRGFVFFNISKPLFSKETSWQIITQYAEVDPLY